PWDPLKAHSTQLIIIYENERSKGFAIKPPKLLDEPPPNRSSSLLFPFSIMNLFTPINFSAHNLIYNFDPPPWCGQNWEQCTPDQVDLPQKNFNQGSSPSNSWFWLTSWQVYILQNPLSTFSINSDQSFTDKNGWQYSRLGFNIPSNEWTNSIDDVSSDQPSPSYSCVRRRRWIRVMKRQLFFDLDPDNISKVHSSINEHPNNMKRTSSDDIDLIPLVLDNQHTENKILDSSGISSPQKATPLPQQPLDSAVTFNKKLESDVQKSPTTQNAHNLKLNTGTNPYLSTSIPNTESQNSALQTNHPYDVHSPFPIAQPVQPNTQLNLSNSEQTSPIPPKCMQEQAWLPDQRSNYCMSCNAKFGMFLRRHHCRSCGLIFCDSCSKYKSWLATKLYSLEDFEVYEQKEVILNFKSIMGIMLAANLVDSIDLKTALLNKDNINQGILNIAKGTLVFEDFANNLDPLKRSFISAINSKQPKSLYNINIYRVCTFCKNKLDNPEIQLPEPIGRYCTYLNSQLSNDSSNNSPLFYLLDRTSFDNFVYLYDNSNINYKDRILLGKQVVTGDQTNSLDFAKGFEALVSKYGVVFELPFIQSEDMALMLSPGKIPTSIKYKVPENEWILQMFDLFSTLYINTQYALKTCLTLQNDNTPVTLKSFLHQDAQSTDGLATQSQDVGLLLKDNHSFSEIFRPVCDFFLTLDITLQNCAITLYSDYRDISYITKKYQLVGISAECPVCNKSWKTIWDSIDRYPSEGWTEVQERHVRECLHNMEFVVSGTSNQQGPNIHSESNPNFNNNVDAISFSTSLPTQVSNLNASETNFNNPISNSNRFSQQLTNIAKGPVSNYSILLSPLNNSNNQSSQTNDHVLSNGRVTASTQLSSNIYAYSTSSLPAENNMSVLSPNSTSSGSQNPGNSNDSSHELPFGLLEEQTSATSLNTSGTHALYGFANGNINENATSLNFPNSQGTSLSSQNSNNQVPNLVQNVDPTSTSGLSLNLQNEPSTSNSIPNSGLQPALKLSPGYVGFASSIISQIGNFTSQIPILRRRSTLINSTTENPPSSVPETRGSLDNDIVAPSLNLSKVTKDDWNVMARYVVYKLNEDTPLLGQECTICFEEFEADQTVARLACFCTYHLDCLKQWFKKSRSCPVHFA
ncbi:hypothetical protein BB560_004411, partial [Smittium megazygosporum]